MQANGDPQLGALWDCACWRWDIRPRRFWSEIADSDGGDNMAWRQIAVVDKDGRTAAHTGSTNEEWKGHVTGPGYVALGNRLTSEKEDAGDE